MTPEEWREVDRVYHAALARPASERAAYVARACAGDAAVQREVESLLAHAGDASAFLETPAAAFAVADVARERFPAGRQLGSYLIRGPLGAGGMGEVYRAYDATLGREVALKILPEQWLADPERRSRLDREARLLAALNHPHIAAIYGVEETDGVRALVLELVEGETLAERVRGSRARPLAEALAIARQIADALDAAHERGIVHRDLKPANIKITPEGVVKVLDFGLAKSGGTGEAGGDLSNSPTMTSGGTQEGMILGTAAYMSPEQARGKPVDKRADIWAFGCVLYEMLTGRAPFGGETTSDIIAAILEREPDWSRLPGSTPPAIRQLLHRCLEKDPKRRLRDIGDARTELHATATVDPVAGGRDATIGSRARRFAPWAIAALLLVALVSALMVRRFGQPATPPQRALRSVIVLPEGQQLDRSGGTHAMALSPDGTMLVYSGVAGDRQLFVREMTAFEPRGIAGTTGALQPFFSPDGKWIGFFAGGSLHKVAVSGGAPLRICEVSRAPRGGSWGANGTIVFATVQDRLWSVPASGGTPQPIPNTDAGIWPEVLPDGKTVLFTTGPEIATVALDGTNRRVLAHTGSDRDGIVVGEGGFNGARYVPAGYIVYGQGVRVLAVPFDVRSHTITGAPVAVSESVFRAQGGGAVYFSVSAAGVLAYAPSGHHELVFVSRDGRATPITADRDAFRMPRLSPDGREIAVAIDDSNTRRADIWVYQADRGTRIRLTTERHNIMPVWTPDGTRVTFSRGAIVERRADGSGSLRTLLSQPDNTYPTSWSRDERHLLINNLSRDAAAGSGDIWVVANGMARPLLTTAAAELHGRFSPDDRWIAYMSTESGRDEVYVIRYPQLDGRVAVSVGGGTFPVWSHDGREIFYRQGLAAMVTGFDTSRGVPIDRPRRLFEGPFVGAGAGGSFDATADGRFLMVRGDEAALGRQINVVTNWFAELR